ncbi:PPPDE putative thiol peptidase family protein [Forsythia ovata]|uniref:PPPDE putative thiol peptidase family protein n=1 Tax=Forsythia ovata TaxID=205694 RepID=A0ABD1T5Z7_9LAMI
MNYDTAIGGDIKSRRSPQAPQFRPSMVAPPAQTGTSDRQNADVERKSKREPSSCGRQQEKKDVSPAGGAQGKTSNNSLLVDPLGDARNKVQEEISSEFSALMATGTMRASEAAALATKRVMQR